MDEIIEDTISRNKQFREDNLKKLNRLRELKAPKSLIEEYELISKMTIGEYKTYRQEQKKLVEQENLEYAKQNPLKKEIVDELYSRFEKLKYDYWLYISNPNLFSEIDLLGFMSREDFHHGLYDSFIDHAVELYRKKYEEDFKNDKHNS